MEKLLTKKEVCEILRISDNTLDRIVTDGSLPSFKIRGQIRFQESDLEAYMQGCRRRQIPVPTTPAKRRSTRVTAPERMPGGAAYPTRYIPGMKVV